MIWMLIKKTANVVLALALLIALGVFVWQAVSYGIGIFAKLNYVVQAGVAGAIGAIFAAFLTSYANRSIEVKRSVEQSMRPKKVVIYQDFISFILKMLLNKSGEKLSTEDLVNFLAESTPLLTTYGSNGVIKKWGKLRVNLQSNANGLYELEELIKEMRKDLGFPNSGLARGDILRLYVNDIDDYLSGKKKFDA